MLNSYFSPIFSHLKFLFSYFFDPGSRLTPWKLYTLFQLVNETFRNFVVNEPCLKNAPAIVQNRIAQILVDFEWNMFFSWNTSFFHQIFFMYWKRNILPLRYYVIFSVALLYPKLFPCNFYFRNLRFFLITQRCITLIFDLLWAQHCKYMFLHQRSLLSTLLRPKLSS